MRPVTCARCEMRAPADGCEGRVVTSSTPGDATHGRPGFGLDLVKRLFRTAYWPLSDFGWVWLGRAAPRAAEPAPCPPPGGQSIVKDAAPVPCLKHVSEG